MFIVWGTHYLSRTNQSARVGECARCKRAGSLKSYDAFKVGHIYFIPLLPLGRVRVWDRCPSCGVGYEAPLAAWESEKSQALAGVRERYGSDPMRAEWALEAFEVAIRFESPERVQPIAEHIERCFLDHPSARARLRQWYLSQGQIAKAETLAGETSKGVDDEGHRTLGLAALAAGDLHAAGRHLSLIAAGTNLDFGNLFTVAERLRKAGQDEDAFAIFTLLFQRYPKTAGSHSNLIRAAARLEQKLRRKILPPGFKPGSDLRVVGALAAAAVLFLLVVDFGLSRLQTLHVVNPTRRAAFVQVGSEKLRLDRGAIGSLTLAEGEYVIRVRMENGLERQTRVEIRNGLVDRFMHRNAFVYAILGAQVLSTEVIEYSRHGSDSNVSDPVAFGGLEFYSLHAVDYAFSDPPSSLSTKSDRETRILLAQLELSPERVIALASQTPSRLPRVNARAYAEGHLLGGNDDEALVEAYWAHCVRNGCEAEARRLLTGLDLWKSASAEAGDRP